MFIQPGHQPLKTYLILKVPFLFDSGEVQSPWIPGILGFIGFQFIALRRCCAFYTDLLPAERLQLALLRRSGIEPPISPR